MGHNRSGFFLTCVLFIFSSSSANIYLEKLSTLYIPLSYDNGSPVYKFDGGSAEQASFDAEEKIVYLVGHNSIKVVDISEAKSPKIIFNQTFGQYDVTDVEYCGGYVFVALDNLVDKENGEVRIFQKYDRTNGEMVQLHDIIVGSLPDMVKPTSDCRTILVAIEAEAYEKNGDIIDPEGGIGVIKFESDDLSKNYTYRILDFRGYNDKWKDLVSRGARFVYRHKNNTFAQDLEPEYIAYNGDESKAYVCLQESNAVVKVDMKTTEIVDIYPLGYKYWGDLKLDVCDDTEINIKQWPVYGMYQPDSIHIITVKDVTYLVTCNEGDSKDYSALVPGGFNEETRVKDLAIKDNSSITAWAANNNFTIQSLLKKSNLGRLKVTTENGREENSYEYSELYAFGARSFSIRSAYNMELVYDSGSDIEERHAQLDEKIFDSNSDEDKNANITWDTRSDDKGPETEGLGVAHVGKMVVLFVGNERPGTISIYSIEDDVRNPRFESIWSGIRSYNGTWKELYDQRLISEIDPEDIRFVPARQSPNGKHMLIVSSAVSGTLSLFEVKGIPEDVVADQTFSSSSTMKNPALLAIFSLLLAYILTDFHIRR